MKTVIAFKVAMYFYTRKKLIKLLELLKKKSANSFKYQPDRTGEPMLWPLEVLISSKALVGIPAAPWLQTGTESKNCYLPICVPLALQHSWFSVFRRNKLKEMQCTLTGLLFCKTRVQAWIGYHRQQLSCLKDTAFSTLNAPMNFRKQALPNPIFSIKHTAPLQWRLFFQIHFLSV